MHLLRTLPRFQQNRFLSMPHTLASSTKFLQKLERDILHAECLSPCMRNWKPSTRKERRHCIGHFKLHSALRGDRKIAQIAATQDATALVHASSKLREDPEFILSTVTLNGLALQRASPLLRQDRTIVSAAIRQKVANTLGTKHQHQPIPR